jgi:hypothetical protein
MGASGIPAGCVARPDVGANDVGETGTAQLALDATAGSKYRLSNATFHITGPKHVTLSGDGATVTAELPTGDYLAMLEDGWVLNQVSPDGTLQPVDATLLTTNPLGFTIQDQQVTSVAFEFLVGGAVIKMGDGDVNVTIKADDGEIDNFTDGDGQILPIGGRSGVWFSFNDGTSGVQVPPASQPLLPMPDGPGGALALHTVGSGFTSFGSGIGANLNQSGATVLPYNASAYKGIRFTYASSGFGSVHLAVGTSATTPPANGGTCNATTETCFDDFQISVPPTSFMGSSATPTFVTLEVPWPDLAQQGFGTPVPFDPSTVLQLKWLFGSSAPFDFILADVSFIE